MWHQRVNSPTLSTSIDAEQNTSHGTRYVTVAGRLSGFKVVKFMSPSAFQGLSG